MSGTKRSSAAKSKTAVKSRATTRIKASKKPAKTPVKRSSKTKPLYFYDEDTSSEGDFLSPWWRCQFQVKDDVYISAGQYILAEKARAFGDKKTLLDILETSSIEELKSIGNRIKNVDDKSWRRRATRITKKANMHKFTSDSAESRALLQRLKRLGKREMIFSDPQDAILGIGFSIADAEDNREQWGANVFGKSLDAVRDITKKTPEPKKTHKSSGYQPFDTSVFDVGGALSVWW